MTEIIANDQVAQVVAKDPIRAINSITALALAAARARRARRPGALSPKC